MKTCFSEGKLTKLFGNIPFLREPLFQLTPLFLSNFFMTPLFAQILETRNPPNFRGEETMILYNKFAYFVSLMRKEGSCMFHTVHKKQPLFVHPFY